MKHTLPKLPYKELPGFSAKLLEYHHGKHHAAYVDNLNKLIKDTIYEKSNLEQIVEKATGKIFNNAAQHWNHSFYWKCMTPDDTSPSDKLLVAIEKKFDSIEALKEKFIKEASSIFGSGWCALVESGELTIQKYKDADNAIKHNRRCLLLVDTWEHSWYLDYQNEKEKYFEAFWKVINWDFVSNNYKK